jgi:hypothetical protein
VCISHGCAEAYNKVSKNWISDSNLQKNYFEDLPNSAEELRQRIKNAVALLTIEEIRGSFKELQYNRIVLYSIIV